MAEPRHVTLIRHGKALDELQQKHTFKEHFGLSSSSAGTFCSLISRQTESDIGSCLGSKKIICLSKVKKKKQKLL